MESKKANKVNIESTPSGEETFLEQFERKGNTGPEGVEAPVILSKISVESYLDHNGEMVGTFKCEGEVDTVRDDFESLLYQAMKIELASAEDIISTVSELELRILEERGGIPQ